MMNHRRDRMPAALLAAALLAVALAAAAVSAGAQTAALDPDELAALLADLEAQGGLLSSDDLALLEATREPDEPAPASAGPAARGQWLLAADLRQTAPPRLEARLRRDDGWLRLGARVRQDEAEKQAIGWAQSGRSLWRMTAGTGSLGHGAGLLTAPLGARASLGIESSLLPPAPGWRPSLAATMPERLEGVDVFLAGSAGSLEAGAARDVERRPVQYARLGWQGGQSVALGVLGLRRDQARAGGVDLRWEQGPWQLAAEVGAWRLQSGQTAQRAWFAAAAWRQRRVRAEFQAAGSRAVAGLPGARRPACLPGWLGDGWAWRLSARPATGYRVGLAGTVGEDREQRQAAGRTRRREVLILSVAGPWSERGTWEVRWRRQDETSLAFDSLQPWLPAHVERRRSRTWLVLLVERPLKVGTGQLAWRRLEEAGQSRDLLGAGWQLTTARVRWRAGWQAAWGDPLDLVTVSVPVSSLVRLRHWGTWENSLLAGCEGRGRWRWQVGGELRRRHRSAGGGLVAECRLQWGAVF